METLRAHLSSPCITLTTTLNPLPLILREKQKGMVCCVFCIHKLQTSHEHDETQYIQEVAFQLPTGLSTRLLKGLVPGQQSGTETTVASFPGSPEREMYTHGEPGIFSHVIMT